MMHGSEANSASVADVFQSRRRAAAAATEAAGVPELPTTGLTIWCRSLLPALSWRDRVWLLLDVDLDEHETSGRRATESISLGADDLASETQHRTRTMAADQRVWQA
eukprot:599940-Rhodomonas_salina.3